MDKQKDSRHDSEVLPSLTPSPVTSSSVTSSPVTSSSDIPAKKEVSRFQYVYNEHIFHSLIKRYFLWSGIYFVILTGGFLIGSFILQGLKGILASIIGAILVLIFCSVTPLTAIIMMRLRYSQRAVISAVMITWVLKLLIVFGALVLLSKREWFNHYTLVIIIFCGVIGILLIESAVMVTSPFGKIKSSSVASSGAARGLNTSYNSYNSHNSYNVRNNPSESASTASVGGAQEETPSSDISSPKEK